MAAQNHTNFPASPFEIGVKLDEDGNLTNFCAGDIDAALVERVADRLIALAESAREQVRRAFFGSPT